MAKTVPRPHPMVNYSEAADTTDTVRADAKASCTICRGDGWHHGWEYGTGYPVLLRCPCVDQNRAAIAHPDSPEGGDADA
jgi:hypothetical protein